MESLLLTNWAEMMLGSSDYGIDPVRLYAFVFEKIIIEFCVALQTHCKQALMMLLSAVGILIIEIAFYQPSSVLSAMTKLMKQKKDL